MVTELDIPEDAVLEISETSTDTTRTSAYAAATRSARSATSNVQYQFWTSVRTITDAAEGQSSTVARNDYATKTSIDGCWILPRGFIGSTTSAATTSTCDATI